MMCRILFLHGILLSVLFTAKSQETLTFSKVLNLGTNSFSITFTTLYNDMPSVQAYDLIVFMEAEQSNFYAETATGNGGSYTAVFPNQIPIPAMEGKRVVLKLSGFQDEDNKLIEGTTTIDSFPAFPDTPSIQAAKYSTDMHVLRVTSSDPGGYDMLDPEPSDKKVENATVIYYLDVPSPVAGSYSLCVKTKEDVLICAGEKTVADAADLLTGTIKSATLKYSLLPTSDNIAVEMEGGDTRIDMIPANEKICSSGDLTVTCSTTATDSIDMRIIGFDADDAMVSYKDHTITDYHLKGQPISTSTIEARWDFQTGFTAYTIKRTPGARNFDTATVNCNPGQAAPCFGYFTGLTETEKYTITLKTNTGDISTDDLNIIESQPISMTSEYSGLQIRFHQLGLRQSGMILSSKVCFIHNGHNKERAFSHYEFVLINKQGQWLKQKLMTQKTDGDLCFTPFTLHMKTFDVTEGAKLIVTQRAIDGFTVLASGEIPVAFHLN